MYIVGEVKTLLVCINQSKQSGPMFSFLLGDVLFEKMLINFNLYNKNHWKDRK